jgi:hypothetical protein
MCTLKRLFPGVNNRGESKVSPPAVMGHHKPQRRRMPRVGFFKQTNYHEGGFSQKEAFWQLHVAGICLPEAISHNGSHPVFLTSVFCQDFSSTAQGLNLVFTSASLAHFLYLMVKKIVSLCLASERGTIDTRTESNNGSLAKTD